MFNLEYLPDLTGGLAVFHPFAPRISAGQVGASGLVGEFQINRNGMLGASFGLPASSSLQWLTGGGGLAGALPAVYWRGQVGAALAQNAFLAFSPTFVVLGSERVAAGDAGASSMAVLVQSGQADAPAAASGLVQVSSGKGPLSGDAELRSGEGTAGASGLVRVISGIAQNSGNIVILSGNAQVAGAVKSGAVFVQSGQGPVSGLLNLSSGIASVGVSGAVNLATGGGPTTGALTVATGASSTGASGAAVVKTGPGPTTGNVSILSGPSSAGPTGNLFVQSGDAVGGDSGLVRIASGLAPGGTRGNIFLDAPFALLAGILQANGYRSADASPGISVAINVAAAGTITVKNGLITGFA